jgi:hypothetical protein
MNYDTFILVCFGVFALIGTGLLAISLIRGGK